MRPKFLLVVALMGIGWVSMKWYLDQTLYEIYRGTKMHNEHQSKCATCYNTSLFYTSSHVWSQMTLRYASKCCIIELTRWMASSMAKIGPWQSPHQWCRKRPRMTWICCQQWCCLMMGGLLISWERDWAQTHPVIQGSFWFVLCFRKLLIAETLKHVCQPVQMAAFEGFSSNMLVYVFAFPSECALTPWSVRKLEEGSTGEDVFFRMSTFDYLQLAKDAAFASGIWGWPKLPRYRWDCDIFWSTRRVEMLGKPEAPWKHQTCTHHLPSKSIGIKSEMETISGLFTWFYTLVTCGGCCLQRWISWYDLATYF